MTFFVSLCIFRLALSLFLFTEKVKVKKQGSAYSLQCANFVNCESTSGNNGWPFIQLWLVLQHLEPAQPLLPHTWRPGLQDSGQRGPDARLLRGAQVCHSFLDVFFCFGQPHPKSTFEFWQFISTGSSSPCTATTSRTPSLGLESTLKKRRRVLW